MIEKDVIIIGAGMCGLTAARRLRDFGRSVLLLEKGHVPGGRMATHRIAGESKDENRERKKDEGGDACFDHGAQFFTVRDDGFRRVTEELLAAGVVREWCRGFRGSLADESPKDGHPRYRGVTGMDAPPKYLARDLEILFDHSVIKIASLNAGVRVTCTGGTEFSARVILFTPPVPESLEILDDSAIEIETAARGALEKIEYDPCIAALVLLTPHEDLPSWGALQIASEPIAFISDNHHKGVSPIPAVTIHAGPVFSRAHLDADVVESALLLARAASEYIAPKSVDRVLGRRWRYSRPSRSHPERYLELSSPCPLVFAGDAFGDSKVEGAFLSGAAAARAIENKLSNGS